MELLKAYLQSVFMAIEMFICKNINNNNKNNNKNNTYKFIFIAWDQQCQKIHRGKARKESH